MKNHNRLLRKWYNTEMWLPGNVNSKSYLIKMNNCHYIFTYIIICYHQHFPLYTVLSVKVFQMSDAKCHVLNYQLPFLFSDLPISICGYTE